MTHLVQSQMVPNHQPVWGNVLGNAELNKLDYIFV